MKQYIFTSVLLMASSLLMASTHAETRFKKASQTSDTRTVLLADDFENGISLQVQKLLNCSDPSKQAGISISSETKASGSNSLKISNSPTVQHAFMPALSQWFKGPELLKSGTLTVSFDIYIPKESPTIISLEARDYSVNPSTNHFKAVITPIGFRLGDISKGFTPGKWIHFEYKIPINKANQNIICTATEEIGPAKIISIPTKSGQNLSWLGIMLLQKNKSFAYMDNLVITVDKTL
ncbi:hypothetical protein PQO03_06435 [Lentisphaera profundi]|uniref:Uncharacterized protein n=1 Tax=Lentisphaera profundi TaxID=1658616 RepID=A0ABY7VMU0_9BACT|nr:hypothetical protein [Lentisphaera profundi]WDE95355.1 hypothetical protein PQO03_06435 [Lentisphaera profundi]